MVALSNSIPASQIVAVEPSVITAGGAGLDMVELFLTTNPRVPIGQILSFPNQASVAGYFGAASKEALAAQVYFLGFDGATSAPGAALFAQYPLANVGAYLRGGNISSLTLTQLQALSGTIIVTIDGTQHTSSSINLSSATSFSNAAQLIAAGLGLTGPTVASFTASVGSNFTATSSGTNLTTTAVTGYISPGDTITGTGITGTVTIVSQTSGTTGGAGVYVTSASTSCSAAAVTAASSVLDVSAMTTGTLAPGQELEGSGVTANTYLVAETTGGGGVGMYTLNQQMHVASEAMTTVTPAVSWDSVSGAFSIISSTTGASSTIGYASGTLAASLDLTQANGAVLSQGAIAAVPGTFMAGVVAITTNWVSFQTLFDPDGGSGNTQKQAFAAWVNGTNNRYLYLAWDTDITPTESTQATGSLGYILEQNQSSGTACIYEVSGTNQFMAAFLGGAIASVDFEATNGRATMAFRKQSGIAPTVTSAAVASNLIANGYNFYGAYSTANETFNFFYPGSVSGEYDWIDSYINQVWLTNQCQLALMTMLTQMKSIPYNPVGYGYIRMAMADPVNAALNFGAIRQNVPLSQQQISEVNALAGFPIDTVLSTSGWYLVIQPASAQVRGVRGSPTIILLYMDGESIQKINLSSVLVQ